MIELTGDRKRDKEIIGYGNRRQFWSRIVYDLERLSEVADKYPIADPEELEQLETVRKMLADLNMAKPE